MTTKQPDRPEGNEVLPPADAASTASGAVGGTPPTPRQLQDSMGKGMVVKQDAPAPLLVDGIPAVNAGAFVPEDHPSFAEWKGLGYLEKFVDPTKE